MPELWEYGVWRAADRRTAEVGRRVRAPSIEPPAAGVAAQRPSPVFLTHLAPQTPWTHRTAPPSKTCVPDEPPVLSAAGFKVWAVEPSVGRRGCRCYLVDGG